MDKMVVAVELGREYLGRCLKLMLICGKIKQTMQGSGRVTYLDLQSNVNSSLSLFGLRQGLGRLQEPLGAGGFSNRRLPSSCWDA
jgi:hypothetical protein